MKSRIRKASKIIGTNFLLMFGLLIIPELILSKYFISSEAYNIPETLVNHNEIWDIKKIENDSGEIKSKYSRDKNGYRPYKVPRDEDKIMLTLGGSTTDQRYVDDKKTWQAIIEKYKNMSVINGGVEGQSSYGHLLAIKKWHSKVLKTNEIDKVLFYIGMNDIRFSKSLDAAKGNVYDDPTKFWKIRYFFSRRSFFYSKLKEAKFKFHTLTGYKAISPDGITVAGHGVTNPSFLKNPIKSNFDLSTEAEAKGYRELFKVLLLTTKNTFKNSKIYIVQQQSPKCLIKDNNVFIRTAEYGINQYCSELASIYFAQDLVLKNLNLQNISVIKMYEDNPIPDEGFYDGYHVNSTGAYYTGKYLLDKL